MQKIPYVNLTKQWESERHDLLTIIDSVMSEGQFVGGAKVDEFECKVAKFCNVKHCVSLNSGTDALVMALRAVGVGAGDEVITVPNSFIASTGAILNVGARPKFIDVLPDQNMDPDLIEDAITDRTKAILPVHLTGRMAAMDRISKVADMYKLPIIEDAAQSIGSRYQNISSGKWGRVGCFSAHPLKNLNACGDAGFLVTDDDGVADWVRRIRNHGLRDRNTVTEFGGVSRLDSIQAAILSYRLERLGPVIEKRRRNAKLYLDLLDRSTVFFPDETDKEYNSFHTFVIQVNDRDSLRNYLDSKGIETSIHYPVPIHLQPASRNLGYRHGDFPVTENQAKGILTLPVNQFLTESEIEYISEHINIYCHR